MTATTETSSGPIAHPPRIADLPAVARESFRAMQALSRSIELEPRLRDLIDVRVSQVNGCAFCLDMHIRRARDRGESQQRLDTLAGWRDAPLFTAPERAALALAEAMTALTGSAVPDAVYEEAARCFDERELSQILFAVAVINGWNRVMITSKTPPPVG
jgi:AhpD family alkylhydroperoxidase